MFILEWLPSWIFYVGLIIGMLLFVVSQFAAQIPFVGQYGLLAAFVSVPVIIISCVFIGIDLNSDTWEKRVLEAENQVKILEARQPEVNRIIVKEYIDRPIEYVRNNTLHIIKEVPKYITKEVDDACVIPLEVIDMHNKAARPQ